MNLEKLKPGRSVLERSRKRDDLPATALYVGSQAGNHRRRLLDKDKTEHLVADVVVQSYYKMVSKKDNETLLSRHWPVESP